MANPPAVAIPEAMLPDIVPLLQRHGIDCEPVALGDSDDPKQFLLLLRCSQAGGVVRLSVQREPHVTSDGFIVVFDGASTGRKQRSKSVALLEAITELLTENGAWVPVRDVG